MNLNRAQLIGRLGKDPEMKTLPSGIQVASFSLATSNVYKDKQGQKQESTEWHNLVIFGKAAETITRYVRKGSLLYVDGRIQTRSWDGQDGKKNYRTEIIIENFQFGPKSANTAPSEDTGDAVEFPKDEVSIDDIPF